MAAIRQKIGISGRQLGRRAGIVQLFCPALAKFTATQACGPEHFGIEEMIFTPQMVATVNVDLGMMSDVLI